MTWTMSDHTQPHELTERCVNGCDKHYECAAKACNKDNMCGGHEYICADCDQDFCFDHVLDLAEPTDANVRFVCLECIAKVVIPSVAVAA